jgi:hypothetical protein
MKGSPTVDSSSYHLFMSLLSVALTPFVIPLILERLLEVSINFHRDFSFQKSRLSLGFPRPTASSFSPSPTTGGRL